MTTGISPVVVGALCAISLQVAVLAAVVWVVSRLCRRAPASWRHALWLIVAVKFLIPPFAHYPSGLAVWQNAGPQVAVLSASAPKSLVESAPIRRNHSEPDGLGTRSAGSAGMQMAQRTELSRTVPPARSDTMLALWMLGASAMLLRLAVRYGRQVSLMRHSTAGSDALTEAVSRDAALMGVGRCPDVRMLGCARAPMLVGIVRSTILLPPEIERACGANELRAMLLHELAHVKRRDIAFAWLQQVVQVVFFFHPVAWLVGHEMSRERELACDEMVLSTSTITPKDYAAGYLSALKLAVGVAPACAALSMAEGPDMEKQRLQTILSWRTPRPMWPWAVALIALAALGLVTFAGPTAKSPQTATELLARITQGRAKAARTMRSGKGTFHYNGYSEGKMPLTLSTLAFSDGRFALRVPDGADVFWDGSKLLMLPGERGQPRAVHFGDERQMMMAMDSYRRLFDVVSQSYPDLKKVLLYHTGKPRIVGRETVDGTQCTVVESVQAFKEPGGGSHSSIRRLWIATARDYVVPKLMLWRQRGRSGPRVLLSRSEVTFRRYGTVWAPARYVHEEHRDGKLHYRVESVYAPDFQLNAKVTEADLSPDEAKPESTPAPRADVAADAEMIAGMTAVEGPGVIVVLMDSPKLSPHGSRKEAIGDYLVHERDVRDVVNELFAAGAEAIAVNDQRLVANSAIRCVGPIMTVNSVLISMPITIRAIGKPETLTAALALPGGVLESLRLLDMVRVKSVDSVLVPGFRGNAHFELARPVQPAKP